MGESLIVSGPDVVQAAPALSNNTINNVQITVRAPVDAMLVIGWGVFSPVVAAVAANGRCNLILNGVVDLFQSDTDVEQWVVGDIKTYNFATIVENLVPGDVLGLEITNGTGVGQNIAALRSSLRCVAYGPEIRAHGVLEDTG